MKKRLLVLCLAVTIISSSLGVCFAINRHKDNPNYRLIEEIKYYCECDKHTVLGVVGIFKYIREQSILERIITIDHINPEDWLEGPTECPNCHQKAPWRPLTH